MATLTAQMRSIVETHTLGFVATVDDDGTPNLSPKGTFRVLDDEHVMFAEIRSPRTLHNIALRPSMEINFIDILARKSVRLKGAATSFARGDDRFDELLPQFERWHTLTDRINGIVVLRIERARLIVSPAYDAGATEQELRAQFRELLLAQ